MGKETGIQWCDHTANFWRGCEKVSPGCDHCYAEAWSRRNPKVLGIWGKDGTRPIAADAYWQTPWRWDRDANSEGVRRRVFCGSLKDFWEDRPDLEAPRTRALSLAADCRHLDWLFLTKRPQNIVRLMSRVMANRRQSRGSNWLDIQMRGPLPNWWMGCTVEDHQRAVERIDVLRDVPAALRFLSCEPLLEPIDLTPWLAKGGIHWVIVGGESNQGGATARPFDVSACEEIVNQCMAYRVPVFVKQFGSRPIAEGLGLRMRDKHGGDMAEWPDWLRVRQIPRAVFAPRQEG